eukprot:3932666-Rhodomonas_salina.1
MLGTGASWSLAWDPEACSRSVKARPACALCERRLALLVLARDATVQQGVCRAPPNACRLERMKAKVSLGCRSLRNPSLRCDEAFAATLS